MADEHTSDLRAVEEGKTVNLSTTEGLTLNGAKCTNRETLRADPRSGEIRETNLWVFEHEGEEYAAAIIDGLASSEGEQGRFPSHNQLTRQDEDFTEVGYIDQLMLHGPPAPDEKRNP